MRVSDDLGATCRSATWRAPHRQKWARAQCLPSRLMGSGHTWCSSSVSWDEEVRHPISLPGPTRAQPQSPSLPMFGQHPQGLISALQQADGICSNNTVDSSL